LANAAQAKNKMTIQELMAQLAKLPTTTRVVVDGYESGYDEVTHIALTPAAPNPNRAWYEGQFDPSQHTDAEMVPAFIAFIA
jgi:hypothetical protein